MYQTAAGHAGLDWDEYARLKQHVLEHTQEPITASDLQQYERAFDGVGKLLGATSIEVVVAALST